MRQYIKKKCYETIAGLDEIHSEIEKKYSNNQLQDILELLELCQQAAISIGNAIEKSEGEGTAAVSYLEKYCDLTYELHEAIIKDGAINNETKALKNLRGFIQKTSNELNNNIRTRKEVVFLPYKASMWDSLESVWKKYEEDEDCDAFVIPIPYYDRNPDGSFAKQYYEIGDFPDYVQVYHYDAYDFEGRHPDEIYIHNPYDDMNYVTSIEPYFYSENLKKYTEKLIYIPYFVLWGIEKGEVVSLDRVEGYAVTKGVINADRVILQSEEVKVAYVEALVNYFGEDTRRVWENKIEGTGSPKIEKVQNIKREDYTIPDEWQRLIEREDGAIKKVIFYNTSLKAFINAPGAMLKKIQKTLSFFEENKDKYTLWWRPHPLFKSTVSSMIPEAWEVYSALVNDYTKNAWGIYDDTPDLDRAIAYSDAYYGDGSSVVELYSYTGKPIMLQDPYI
ncbi:hypothetical protein SAMN04487829_1467 [Pseudobutyrivibrio sp. NOR37]|uniref:CDP-Glycerol:Poly(Glycerophosphate) glycerophosphotransferase n=1 Tax=Pseudobutyrivibrio xylanivorans TaxID=185007 RepID=A0A6M0LI79_PSEXY|nr:MULTISPECIES: hypothetical protein [Pseudobutyrivibrio]NEX01860.1 hypothetical protein [Pseudobutyrivibrio xylanivorans]SFR72312.1 hypothetical protein SAMN04487829_1467 [Pseudobutyrivibrio sp. NOR37]